MPITVQGPDGAEIEFPDGTPSAVMQKAMANHYGSPAQPTQTLKAAAPQSFLDKHGRTLATTAGGIIGGAIAAPEAAVASVPTLGLGGLATEAAGVGMGAAAGGQLYDTARNFLTGNKPKALAEQLKQVGSDVATNAIGVPVGAVAGQAVKMAGQGLAGSAAKALTTPTAAKTLSNMGIQLTPGQMMGGALKRIEDAATSIPIAGDFIKSAQRAGMEQFNKTALNKVLAPIGKELPKNVSAGREAVSFTQKAVSDAYAPLKSVSVTPDKPFMDAINKIEKTPIRGAFNDDLMTAIDNVRRNLGPKTSGTDFKLLDEELGSMARSAPNTPTGRQLSKSLNQIRSEMDGLLGRTNPKALESKKAADNAFATLVRVDESAASLGAKEGVFSPAQLASAVKKFEGGPRNARYAAGQARLQNLSDAANTVLPSSVPDSGTALRSLMSAGVPGTVAATLTSIPSAAIYNPVTLRAINAIYKASTPGMKRQALAKFAEIAGNDKALRTVYNAIQSDIQGQNQ